MIKFNDLMKACAEADKFGLTGRERDFGLQFAGTNNGTARKDDNKTRTGKE